MSLQPLSKNRSAGLIESMLIKTPPGGRQTGLGPQGIAVQSSLRGTSASNPSGHLLQTESFCLGVLELKTHSPYPLDLKKWEWGRGHSRCGDQIRG